MVLQGRCSIPFIFVLFWSSVFGASVGDDATNVELHLCEWIFHAKVVALVTINNLIITAFESQSNFPHFSVRNNDDVNRNEVPLLLAAKRWTHWHAVDSLMPFICCALHVAKSWHDSTAIVNFSERGSKTKMAKGNNSCGASCLSDGHIHIHKWRRCTRNATVLFYRKRDACASTDAQPCKKRNETETEFRE